MEFTKREIELFNKYPKLFRRAFLSQEETGMCWGLEIPDKWISRIEALCEMIEEVAPNVIEFEQIKEKFRSIRVYYDFVEDVSPEISLRISSLISAVEYACSLHKYSPSITLEEEIDLTRQLIQNSQYKQDLYYNSFNKEYHISDENHRVFDYMFNNFGDKQDIVKIIETSKDESKNS